MCGFTVQLVEHRTGISGGHGFEPVEALIFSGFICFSCFNWKIYCDDQFFTFVFRMFPISLRKLNGVSNISPRNGRQMFRELHAFIKRVKRFRYY